MLSHRLATTSVAALALTALTSTTALAATEQEITDALKAMFSSSTAEVNVELGTPSAEGDALVYKDVKVTSSAADSKADGTIATLTLTGADVNDAGGLTADELSAEGVEVKGSDGETATIASVEIANLDVTPAKDGDTGYTKADSATARDITITGPDSPPVTVASVNFEASEYDGQYPRRMAFSVEEINVDVAAAGADDPTVQQMKDLGYDKLVLGVSAEGRWDESAATMNVEDFTIEAKDMGSFSFTGVLGGFTQEVLDMLQTPEPSEDVMQKITLNEAALSFNDASITNRLLDMQAKQMGSERAAFVEQITAALPLMLSAVGNPGFQEKIAAAAGIFLKDPKNITVSIKPDQPVDLMSLTMTAQTAPQSLPDVLKAEVKANEPTE